jgi:hypothetical protein
MFRNCGEATMLTMLTVKKRIGTRYLATPNIAFQFHFENTGLLPAYIATRSKETMSSEDTNEEVAIVELTLPQLLEMRYDDAVGQAIEDALNNDPFYYRPYEKKSDKWLVEEIKKCDAACVTAKILNEKPDPKIDGKRRDIAREQKIRSGEIKPEDYPAEMRVPSGY